MRKSREKKRLRERGMLRHAKDMKRQNSENFRKRRIDRST